MPSAVIADDEPLLRAQLRDSLAALWPELRIVAEAGHGEEAVRAIVQHRPDIAFLDIEMPGMNGLAAASQVKGLTHIAFITAYSQYALDAFERGAIDYVLKPASEARLAETVARLRQRVLSAAPPPEALATALAQVAAALGKRDATRLRWVQAAVGNQVRLIPVDDVLFFQSDLKYTRVVTARGESLIRRALKDLEAELDAEQFWQIHRSTIVNSRAIAHLERTDDRLVVVVRDCAERLEVSRSSTRSAFAGCSGNAFCVDGPIESMGQRPGVTARRRAPSRRAGADVLCLREELAAEGQLPQRAQPPRLAGRRVAPRLLCRLGDDQRAEERVGPGAGDAGVERGGHGGGSRGGWRAGSVGGGERDGCGGDGQGGPKAATLAARFELHGALRHARGGGAVAQRDQKGDALVLSQFAKLDPGRVLGAAAQLHAGAATGVAGGDDDQVGQLAVFSDRRLRWQWRGSGRQRNTVGVAGALQPGAAVGDEQAAAAILGDGLRDAHLGLPAAHLDVDTAGDGARVGRGFDLRGGRCRLAGGGQGEQQRRGLGGGDQRVLQDGEGHRSLLVCREPPRPWNELSARRLMRRRTLCEMAVKMKMTGAARPVMPAARAGTTRRAAAHRRRKAPSQAAPAAVFFTP